MPCSQLANRSRKKPVLGCSKLGKGNPGLVWNLISGLKALRENSIQIFLLAIWSLDVLKRIVKIFPKRLLNKEIKKPELKFNPGLGLSGLWTTGPRIFRAGQRRWAIWYIFLYHFCVWRVKVMISDKNKRLNPLSPTSDQDGISPYTISTISSRQVMRIKKNIN